MQNYVSCYGQVIEYVGSNVSKRTLREILRKIHEHWQAQKQARAKNYGCRPDVTISALH